MGVSVAARHQHTTSHTIVTQSSFCHGEHRCWGEPRLCCILVRNAHRRDEMSYLPPFRQNLSKVCSTACPQGPLQFSLSL
jgi:hypothetical protein